MGKVWQSVLNRRVIGLVLVGVTVIAGGRAAYGRLMSRPDRDEAVSVYATAEVRRGTIRVAVEGSGELQPVYHSSLEAPAAGTIEEMLVSRGQKVEKGQLVATLRNDEVAYEVAELEFQLERAVLQLANVLGVPKSEVTRVDPGRGVYVVAPMSGRLVSLDVEVGDTLSEGSLVGRIVDDSSVITIAELVATEMDGVAEGQRVTMKFDEFSGSAEGVVTDVDPTPIPKGEGFVYRVTIEAPNPGLFQPEHQFRATIHTPRGDVTVGSPLKIDRYRQEMVVRSLAEGTITAINVRKLGLVKTGQIIVTLGGEATKRYVEEKQLEIRELQVKIAKKQEIREKMVVVSPITGTVAWIRGGPGTYVNAGEPIGSIFDNSKMNVMVRVDEIDVVHLKDGQEADVTVEALPGRKWKGKVLAVDMMGKSEGGFAQYGVELQVEDTQELKPGMTANVSIFVDEKQDVMLVPIEAVFEQDGEAMVEVLDSDEPRAVPVKLGLVNDQVAEVVSGLEEGQVVVTGSSLDRLDRAREEGAGGGSRSGGGKEPLVLPSRRAGGAVRLP